MGDSLERKISIIIDSNGKKIVVVHDIIFIGKRKINWKDVEGYLKQYIGKIYQVVDTQDLICIGKDLADEYSGSNDTARLKGTLAKAKANAAQAVPELIEIAGNRRFKSNMAVKHNINAKYGWYRYDSKFALPVYNEDGKIERYNIFLVEILIRHAADGQLYLYDMVNIKKETSTPFE